MPRPAKFASASASAASANNGALRRFIHGLLFISGGLALVYEVLWLRRFTTIFGATTLATAATLAAVFVGLTAGSAFFGARAVRFERPLRAYGFLEIGVGLTALLVGPLLMGYDHFYPAFYGWLNGAPVAFGAVELLLTMAALFAPTFCMGGTFPVLAQALSAEQGRIGVMGSGLYAANTLGAAAGALSVPCFWLPTFGATSSYTISVALSVLVGVMAWLLDLRAPKPALPLLVEHKAKRRNVLAGPEPMLPGWVLAALAALSGALMFILQVAWTRMFAQVHENSIYSFAVVVAVFILGLAGGATMARELLRRSGKADRFFGWAWVAGGAAVFASPHLFVRLTNGLSYLPQQAGWVSYGLGLAGLALATLLVPTLLAGMVLPLLMELAGRVDGRPAGKVLGRLLATNTLGVVAGALLAALVLPKWLGLWSSIAGVGVLMMITGEFCAGEWCRLRPRRLMIAALIITGLLFWNPAKLPRTKVRESRGEKLVALMEGSHGIVAVVDQSGRRRLKLDNFYGLGGTASTGDERMQAHIPLLLHPAPKQVAFLGLGTGITAGGALLHPIERVTAVELVPEVVNAAKAHFAEANLGILHSPRVEVVVDDARNFLRGSGRKFDVIVGDLVVPWRQGEAALYSAEHFAAARRALAPGGIFCQWLPMFQLSEEEFRMVTATFLDVFPATTLWRGDFAPDQPALALVGQLEAVPIDAGSVARRVHEMRRDEMNPHLAHPAGVWIFLVGPLHGEDPQFATAKRNRENRPWLEILGPWAHAGAARGERGIFVGRRLASFLDEVRARLLAGSALSGLSGEPLQWAGVGAQLGEASLLMAEGRKGESYRLMREASSSLPAEIRNTLVAEEPPASKSR